IKVTDDEGRGLMIGVFRLKKILMRVEYPQELFSAVDLLSLQFLGAPFTQGTIPSIPIGSSISPEGFLLLVLLLHLGVSGMIHDDGDNDAIGGNVMRRKR
ncbi:hypothetical protein Tco_0038588, partial [Tanacetum coccineum]